MEERRHHERELATRFVRATLAIGVAALLLALFSPFLSSIAWAAVLCYALRPVHQRVLLGTGGRQLVSALLMSVVLTVGLILPIISLSFLIGEELVRLYTDMAETMARGEGLLHERWRSNPLVAMALDRLQQYERLTGTDLRSSFADNLNAIGKALIEQLTGLTTDLLLGVLELLLTIVCAFFFFRDWDAIAAWLGNVLPFSRQRQELMVRRIDEVVKGSIYGNTAVAVLEGLVGGVAFWATGLPSPVLWGTVMGLLSYLPVAGASLIWIPAALYFLTEGAYGPMTGILIAGALITLVDYGVRNLLVASRVRLHPLLVFFSVLGGIKLLGLLGLVAGPLTVALGKATVEIYQTEQAKAAG
ncbi:MAG: AI-2E family transporter [Nitrospirota bacterium]